MSRVSARFIIFGSGTDQVNATYIPANYTPINYTPTQVGSEGTNKISAHLQGIDLAFLPKAGGTMTGQLVLQNGTAAAPALVFTGATTSGLYEISATSFGMATNGVSRVTIDTVNFTTTLPHLAPVGTVSAPSYSFTGDPGTGWYHPASSQLAATLGGVQQLLLTTSAATFAQSILGPVGSVGTPTYSFTGDTSTGFYHPAASQIAATIAGTQVLLVTTSSVTSAQQILGPVGSASTPTYSYTGDTGTGWYRPGASQLAAVLAGTQVLSLTTSAATFAKNIIGPVGAVGTPTFSFSGDTSTGIYHPTTGQVAIAIAGVQTFTVSAASATSTVVYVAPAGTVSAPSHTFNGSTSTGLYSPAVNQLGLTANGDLMLWTNGTSLSTNGTASADYSLTNGGGVVSAHLLVDPAGSLTSGNAFGFGSINGFTFLRANGVARIARSAIQLTGTTDTAGSETGGLTFLTQTAGAAMVENLRILPTGQVLVNGAGQTATPTSRLVVFASGADNGVSVAYYGTTNTAVFNGFRARGTLTVPTAVLADDTLATYRAKGQYDSTIGDASGEAASIRMVAAENFSASANGTYMQFFTTAATTTTLSERMRILASGSIGINTTTASVAASTPQVTLDVNGVMRAQGFASYLTSTAVANTTTTLTNASNREQVWTGSTTGQIVKLPDATTLIVGRDFEFTNSATVSMTVQDNGGTVLARLSAGQVVKFICTGVGSAAGTWISNAAPFGKNFFNSGTIVTSTNSSAVTYATAVQVTTDDMPSGNYRLVFSLNTSWGANNRNIKVIVTDGTTTYYDQVFAAGPALATSGILVGSNIILSAISGVKTFSVQYRDGAAGGTTWTILDARLDFHRVT